MRATVLMFLVLAGCPKQGGTEAPIAPAPAPVPAPVPATPAPAPEASAWGVEAPATPGPEAAPAGRLPAPDQRQLGDAVAMLLTQDPAKAQGALERLQSLQSQHPDVAVIHYNLGNAFALLGRTDEARRAWIRATEVEPGYARAWVNLGVLNARNGRPDLALASYQSGLRYAPEALELHAAAVGALREQRRHEEAIAQARAAMKINSKDIRIYNELALVYLDTNKLDLARFVLEKALSEIEGAAGDAQLHASLGQVFYRQGYPGNALESFKKALDIDPMQATALQFLGSYHLDNRAYADAAPLWERVCGLMPSEAGPRLNLGIAYRGLGRYEDAKRSYEEALRLDPKNPEPYRNLAVLYGDYMKAYDAAVQALEDYRKAGGAAAEIDAWIQAVRKEQKRAEDRRRREEERKRREAAEAAAQVPAPEPAPSPQPAPEPAPQPAPQPEPAPSGGDDPWGSGGGG